MTWATALLALSGVLATAVPAEAAAPPERWVARFNGHADFGDSASSVAEAKGRVFVTGGSTSGPQLPEPYDSDIVTIAYSARSGSTLWKRTYDGPARSSDGATTIATSPDGSTVFVAGTSFGREEADILVIAYEARTGRRRWVARYGGPRGEDETAADMVVAPDGSAVFVTGVGEDGVSGDADIVTVAYGAGRGHRKWVARVSGGAGTVARAITVAGDGSAVIVAGNHQTAAAFDAFTIAYDATNGSRLWSDRYDGPAQGADGLLAATASDDTAYVTGESHAANGLFDYVTIAYDVATGDRMWVRRYGARGDRDDIAWDVAVSPDAADVYVTGASVNGAGNFDYATLAYDAATGATAWRARYPGPSGGDDQACCVGVSRDGTTVYVAGTAVYGQGSQKTLDFGLVAYDASTGTRIFVAHHDGPVGGHDHARALAVGGKVVVTGDAPGRLTGIGPLDYETVAYAG
jgi:PQQ-like domain